MTIGRPPKYTDPEEMQTKIEDYFQHCKTGRDVTIIRKQKAVTIKQRIPASKAGLALHLGFNSRQSLDDYTKQNNHGYDPDKKQAFTDIIAQATLRCEADLLEGAAMGLFESKITGLVLATSHKYANKQEVIVKPEDSLSDQELDARIESKVKSLGLITRSDQPGTLAITGPIEDNQTWFEIVCDYNMLQRPEVDI